VPIQAFFGLSVLMSFVAFGLVTKLYIWPWLRSLGRDKAMLALMVPHSAGSRWRRGLRPGHLMILARKAVSLRRPVSLAGCAPGVVGILVGLAVCRLFRKRTA